MLLLIYVCVLFFFFFFSSRRRHTRFDCDWSSCIFFFQAKDGIRDLTVTGVQTCALPILQSLERLALRLQLRAVPIEVVRAVDARKRLVAVGAVGEIPHAGRGRIEPLEIVLEGRSEERRVGKECRSRWTSYHLKIILGCMM